MEIVVFQRNRYLLCGTEFDTNIIKAKYTMNKYFDLSGQVAVVTGASAGLGLQMAKAFASQGANLVL